eukprot:TRINITY_DN14139_c0_g1_i1.p1 TRINITY_DN14139_c0_g1~~TRINITY_DN14139_c0_g1_i1.p1  ORF type:complete len:219 (+),score=49.53 TRINITY_DN14139_c0_g1_i1:457-1113(+)
MFFCVVESGEFVFKKGDDASSVFLIAEGTMEVIIDGSVKRLLKPGDLFGEYAVLYNAPRSASLRAQEPCSLWGIDRQTFRLAIEEMMNAEFRENRAFIEDIRLFEHMTSEQKDVIANNMITQRFEPGQVIVEEGDQASSFYLIKEGTVSILKGDEETRKLHKKDFFGEQALFFGTVRQRTVKAFSKTVLLAIGCDAVNATLGNEIEAITFRNLKIGAI